MRPLIGAGFVFFGSVIVVGGITGHLAPMLAALFVPSALGQAPGEGFGIHLGPLPHLSIPIPGGGSVPVPIP